MLLTPIDSKRLNTGNGNTEDLFAGYHFFIKKPFFVFRI